MELEREAFLRVMNEARVARHLSVRGAAKAAGVPAATMQGWLNGRHVPTPALRPKFQAFVEQLGIPPEATARWWESARS
ncbi:MAG: helix-turn-helix domain-containing protein [Propionicimonas sp.]